MSELTMQFQDRDDAGMRLAEVMKQFQTGQRIVLAIPRGGVPVAVKIAQGWNVSPEASFVIYPFPIIRRLAITRLQKMAPSS